MYLLFLDESGTHGQSPCFILGGVAVHENDVYYLQRKFDQLLIAALTPLGQMHLDFELHATEIKSPLRQRGASGGRRGSRANTTSKWARVPAAVRFQLLDDVYKTLATYQPHDPRYPMAFFGAAVARTYSDKAKRAYDVIFNKFDEMLGRHYNERNDRQRGLVIHDEHQIERDLQSWTSDWRHIGSRIGRLNNIVDVPMFTDSRSSRLLQVADFVAFAMWRHYGVRDDKWLDMLLPGFDHVGDARHGIIHIWPQFGRVACPCPPCDERASRAS